MVYATRAFWLGATERAVKTLGQSGVAFVTADATGLLELDGLQLLSVVGLATLASLFTSLASPTFVAGEGAPEV